MCEGCGDYQGAGSEPDWMMAFGSVGCGITAPNVSIWYLPLVPMTSITADLVVVRISKSFTRISLNPVWDFGSS